jgi:branched-chain amino acid transport system substrate-binding protein
MNKKSWKFLVIGYLLLFGLIYLGKKWIFSDNAVYIAVVGSMSGENQANGIAMRQAIELYFHQVNRQGGINGQPVKLLEFDDKNQPQQAETIAKQIATNSKAVAVIGHSIGQTSLDAAPIYQKYGIPMITGTTADKKIQNNDWYFRVIFNNREQGAFLANYAHKVLGYEKAYIFFDGGAYGQTLADAFIQTAKMIGLEISNQWHFNHHDPTSFQNSLKQMMLTLKQPENSGILFLAAHPHEAIPVIAEVDHLMPIIGTHTLSSQNFINKIKEYPEERHKPGYFTDGLYLTTPFISEIANKRVLDFQQDFVKKYHQTPSTTAALHYDAAKVMVHALKKVPPKLTNLQEKRRLLKESLWQISDSENAVAGITGTIYFDHEGNAVKSIPMAVYKKGKMVPALPQYRLLTNPRNVKQDILSEVFNHQLIKINGKAMTQAQVVYVGIDFNEISELDTQKSIYTADFYLWFRFKTEDFKDNQINFLNVVVPKEGELEQPFIDEISNIEGQEFTTRTYRIKTQFKGRFDFHNFPLDRQLLPIQFRHQHKTRDTLIYVIDREGMKMENLMTKFQEKGIFSVDGWEIKEITFFEEAQENDSTFGLPEYFYSQQRIEYSLFNVVIEIEREVLSFIFKNLFPTFILIFLGYGIFFTTTISIQIALGVNIILPTSILHVRLASELPDIAYFTLVEYFFYLSYLMALLCIALALLIHVNAEHERRFKMLLLIGRIGYPIFILICFAFVGFQYFANLQ